jgi:hypothetical protein
MIINTILPNIEMSKELDEKFFSIGDPAFVFDILRKKLYSNIILAVCRESTCNARDSHREAGKSDLPIEIYLPNNIEPYFKVKDYGIGISPDQMENVFIKFGVSTKTHTNLLVGGFGIGIKCLFGYTDSFNIISNYNNIQYNYACFIDETKIGKLILLSSVETKLGNGVEVIVPVKECDFENFSRETLNATEHWKIKPILKGRPAVYRNIVKDIEGDGWTVSNRKDYYSNKIYAIIDGIEYPVDSAALNNTNNNLLLGVISGDLLLYFDNGELSLSANREQIYLDDSTKRKINSRLLSVVNDVKNKTKSKIDSFTSLLEACVYYRDFIYKNYNSNTFYGASILSWRDVSLINAYQNRFETFYYVKNGDKIKRSIRHQLTLDADSLIVKNDTELKAPGYKHINKLFENNAKIKSVQIVCDDSNSKILEAFNPILLSSLGKVGKNNKSSYKQTIFKFNYNHFTRSSIDKLKEDKNIVLCNLSGSSIHMTDRFPLHNGKTFSLNEMSAIQKQFPDNNFYGVDKNSNPDRVKKIFTSAILLDDFLKSVLLDKKYFLPYKYIMDNYISANDSLISYSDRFFEKIKNKESSFLKRVGAHKKVSSIKRKQLALSLFEMVNGKISIKDMEDFIKENPEYNLSKFDKAYIKDYPLLSGVYFSDEKIDDITNYVNLIDAQIEENKCQK